MIKKILLLVVVTSCVTTMALAKAKIPFGKMDKIEIVADLPDTETYERKEGSKDYLDLARLHQEFNIAWLIPAWITEEPKLVLSKKGSDEYYEITEAQLNEILKENKLDKDKLIGLGFYTRYGGKLVLLLIIGLIIWGIMQSKKG